MVMIGETYRRKIRCIADRLMPMLYDSERSRLQAMLEQMELDGGMAETELSEMMLLLQPQELSGNDSADEQQQEKQPPADDEQVSQDREWSIQHQMRLQMFSLLEYVRQKHMSRLRQKQKTEMKKNMRIKN